MCGDYRLLANGKNHVVNIPRKSLYDCLSDLFLLQRIMVIGFLIHFVEVEQQELLLIFVADDSLVLNKMSFSVLWLVLAELKLMI